MAHYGTEAAFEAYCARMGYTASSGDVDPALERATAYLDGHYGARYPGKPTGGYAQVLGWPRTGVTDCHGYTVPSDTVPPAIENATYEAALREGHYVVSVAAGTDERRDVAARILSDHGGHFVNFLGRHTMQMMVR